MTKKESVLRNGSLVPRKPTKVWVVVTERGKSEGRWVAVTRYGTRYWYLAKLNSEDNYVPRDAHLERAGFERDGQSVVSGWYTQNGSVEAYESQEKWRDAVWADKHWRALREAFAANRWASNPPKGLTVGIMRDTLSAIGVEPPNWDEVKNVTKLQG